MLRDKKVEIRVTAETKTGASFADVAGLRAVKRDLARVRNPNEVTG